MSKRAVVVPAITLGVAAILLFTIEVKNRKHLADVMRRVRRLAVVTAVRRHPV